MSGTRTGCEDRCAIDRASASVSTEGPSALADPDPDRGGLRFGLEPLEFGFAHELTRRIDSGPSGLQHRCVEQRAVVEEHVRSAIAVRSDQRVVLDVNRLAERELSEEITRRSSALEVNATADGRRGRRLPPRLRR